MSLFSNHRGVDFQKWIWRGEKREEKIRMAFQKRENPLRPFLE
jgi:hypothetical protein